MKVETRNRQGDKYPVLTMEAENQAEGEQLKELLNAFKEIQEIGIGYGVATDGYPPCGCSAHHYALDSITVRILLGQGG